MYRFFIKRLLDALISTVGFVVLLPVFILITIMLTIANGGSPFFFQLRPGRNEKYFSVIKFKTMNDRRDPGGVLLPDHLRLTPIGKFVRKTSLDEIPQLLNVIVGQMSLVGPRPLLPEYLSIYSPEERKRHHVRPGITGWAQVNGRNTISWKKKFEYDVWYVDNFTFLLDVKIMFMTVAKVLKADGISATGVATAEKYNGSN